MNKEYYCPWCGSHNTQERPLDRGTHICIDCRVVFFTPKLVKREKEDWIISDPVEQAKAEKYKIKVLKKLARVK